MGKWLFLVIFLQLACAFCAVRLDRPAIWLRAILLVPLLGSLAYCGFEMSRGLARFRPSPLTPKDPMPAPAELGWLGYQAVRARTADSRRALAEECMRAGRHADARLLFESCMVGRHARDPGLIAGREQAMAAMKASGGPAGIAEDGAPSITP